MCNCCKGKMKNNKMPPRCIRNGLTTVPIPPELSKLDALSSQLIQKTKCYQTVVRLGMYTAKVPVYNSLKACKGTMFFLPLPLKKTFETLDQVKMTTKAEKALPHPELYIINARRACTRGLQYSACLSVCLLPVSCFLFAFIRQIIPTCLFFARFSRFPTIRIR